MPFQVVVVPCGITTSLDQQTRDNLIAYCESVISALRDGGVRVKGDFRDNYSPGWKFNHWELKVWEDICACLSACMPYVSLGNVWLRNSSENYPPSSKFVLNFYY